MALPPRPDLGHLRGQAKALLQQLKDGDMTAAKAFIAHLPAAKALSPTKVRAAGFRLADAQSVVARKSGFASWPSLARHVGDLRALEGDWRFASLEVDGRMMPAAAVTNARILIDGDRFRTESADAIYEGVFVIDVERSPHGIDLEFVDGPEAGQTALGIYELDGDRLTICLALAGSTRPAAFKTTTGSGHALERLARVSTARPVGVTGGTRKTAAKADAAPRLVDPNTFDVPMTPLLERLQGEWAAVELVQDGTPMQAEWLSYGSRRTVGNEMKVVFGGQTMSHAKMRFDESASPIAVDYLHLSGAAKGRVSRGLFEWIGHDARFAIAAPDEPRPHTFEPSKTITLSRWRKYPMTSSK